MKTAQKILALGMAASLTACGLPIYKHDPTQSTTKLNTTGMSSPQVCTQGKAYKLSITDDGMAEIPTGDRIGIASAFYTGDGHMNYSCRPTISFTPQDNINYVGVLLFKNNACYLQILREDPSTPTGLDWEPSVRRGGC